MTETHILHAFNKLHTLNIKDVLDTDTEHVFRLHRHRPGKRQKEIKSAGRFESADVELGAPHECSVRGWTMDDADIERLKEFLKNKENEKKKRAADDEKSSKKKKNKKRKKAKANNGDRDGLDDEEERRLDQQRLEQQRLEQVQKLAKERDGLHNKVKKQLEAIQTANEELDRLREKIGAIDNQLCKLDASSTSSPSTPA